MKIFYLLSIGLILLFGNSSNVIGESQVESSIDRDIWSTLKINWNYSLEEAKNHLENDGWKTNQIIIHFFPSQFFVEKFFKQGVAQNNGQICTEYTLIELYKEDIKTKDNKRITLAYDSIDCNDEKKICSKLMFIGLEINDDEQIYYNQIKEKFINENHRTITIHSAAPEMYDRWCSAGDKICTIARNRSGDFTLTYYNMQAINQCYNNEILRENEQADIKKRDATNF